MRQNQRIALQIAAENLNPYVAHVPGPDGKLVPKSGEEIQVSVSDELTKDEKTEELSLEKDGQQEDPTTESPDSSISSEPVEQTQKKKSPFPPKKKKKEDLSAV